MFFHANFLPERVPPPYAHGVVEALPVAPRSFSFKITNTRQPLVAQRYVVKLHTLHLRNAIASSITEATESKTVGQET